MAVQILYPNGRGLLTPNWETNDGAPTSSLDIFLRVDDGVSTPDDTDWIGNPNATLVENEGPYIIYDPLSIVPFDPVIFRIRASGELGVTHTMVDCIGYLTDDLNVTGGGTIFCNDDTPLSGGGEISREFDFETSGEFRNYEFELEISEEKDKNWFGANSATFTKFLTRFNTNGALRISEIEVYLSGTVEATVTSENFYSPNLFLRGPNTPVTDTTNIVLGNESGTLIHTDMTCEEWQGLSFIDNQTFIPDASKPSQEGTNTGSAATGFGAGSVAAAIDESIDSPNDGDWVGNSTVSINLYFFSDKLSITPDSGNVLLRLKYNGDNVPADILNYRCWTSYSGELDEAFNPSDLHDGDRVVDYTFTPAVSLDDGGGFTNYSIPFSSGFLTPNNENDFTVHHVELSYGGLGEVQISVANVELFGSGSVDVTGECPYNPTLFLQADAPTGVYDEVDLFLVNGEFFESGEVDLFIRSQAFDDADPEDINLFLPANGDVLSGVPELICYAIQDVIPSGSNLFVESFITSGESINLFLPGSGFGNIDFTRDLYIKGFGENDSKLANLFLDGTQASSNILDIFISNFEEESGIFNLVLPGSGGFEITSSPLYTVSSSQPNGEVNLFVGPVESSGDFNLLLYGQQFNTSGNFEANLFTWASDGSGIRNSTNLYIGGGFYEEFNLFLKTTESTPYFEEFNLYLDSNGNKINNTSNITILNEWIKASGITNFYLEGPESILQTGNLPLFIARDNEGVALHTPIFMNVVNEQSGNFNMFIDGVEETLSDNVNLVMLEPTIDMSGNASMYSHGF